MDSTNFSVNEFIRYWVKQNRKKLGYDWFEDRKTETRASRSLFDTDRGVCSATASKTDSTRKADIKSGIGTGSTEIDIEKLEIW